MIGTTASSFNLPTIAESFDFYFSPLSASFTKWSNVGLALKELNSEPLPLCKFLGGPWTLYISLKWRTMWDGFFLSNGANQWNLLNIFIIERTYQYTVPRSSKSILLKFTKLIWSCVWISLICTGCRIALFLNWMLNYLNFGL